MGKRRAEKLHRLITKKIDEMMGDPFTLDADWRELLPIAEYADNVIKNDAMYANLSSLAERIRQYLGDGSELQNV